VQYSLLQLDPPGMVIPTSTAQKATEYTATSLVCGRIYKALGEPRGESELSNGCGNSFPWFSMVFHGFLGISGDLWGFWDMEVSQVIKSWMSWYPLKSSVLDGDFPWTKPSSYWGIPIEPDVTRPKCRRSPASVKAPGANLFFLGCWRWSIAHNFQVKRIHKHI
jgi:hypothetical protein